MTTKFAPWAATDRPSAFSVRSDDGVVAVALQRTSGGVFVERVIQRPGIARVVQAFVFPDAGSFHRWCDADMARFEYPLLHSRLGRYADRLFDSQVAEQTSG